MRWSQPSSESTSQTTGHGSLATHRANSLNFLNTGPNRRPGSPGLAGRRRGSCDGRPAVWGGADRGDFAYLKRTVQPTLVLNGSHDIVDPTVNSYILEQNLPDAELILLPDSNHGPHFQFPELFNRYATEFLDR
jgi:pimeloyl-ACP methyl ester carboxylesterase